MMFENVCHVPWSGKFVLLFVPGLLPWMSESRVSRSIEEVFEMLDN
jgi:hypothetical protein